MSTPVQTYKQVVETFRGIAESHMLVKEFGIGRPSDFDVENDVYSFQRYPQVFLEPQTSTIARFGRTILGFNMIVADIAESNEQPSNTNAQNNAFMIIQDILSKILLTTWDEVDINLLDPITIVPFQEGGKNGIAGWTAILSVEVKSPLNLCDSAFIQ